MFAFQVDLLAGRYAATAYNDRDRVEWPPHPARLFSALVAAWGDGEPHGITGVAERAALEWLEAQHPPEVLADRAEHSGPRSVAPVFVPVNDEFEVGEVDREKLEEAEAVVSAAADGKAQSAAVKVVEKLRAKFASDTLKAIAVPSKFGKELRAGLRVLPEYRGKQPRTFPVAFPASPHFAFAWSDAEPNVTMRHALAALASRVVRLGHSSSQVHVSIADESTVELLRRSVASFLPDAENGQLVVRWVSEGQVARLCRAYDLHRETEPRVLPARFVRYTLDLPPKVTAYRQSLFAPEFVVLEQTRGPRLAVTSVAGLARQLRRALMSYAEQPVHPMISGHREDGAPTDEPHVAIVPLPFVGHEHADGGVMGIAIVLPRDATAEAKRALARAIARFEQRWRVDAHDESPELELLLTPAPIYLRRVMWESGRATLDPSRWTRLSRRWATATPIALDRNPGDLHDRDVSRRAAAFAAATEILSDAVVRIGLPRPVEIDVVRSVVLPGAAKPRMYPRFPHVESRSQRVLVHARIVFAEPVGGPVLIGAGRFQGLGLCAPVDATTRRAS